MTTVVYLSDFTWRHGTETHIAATLEDLGCTVHRVPERTVDSSPEALAEFVHAVEADLFLYTRSFGFPPHQRDAAVLLMHDLKAQGVTTASFHLDLYLGLHRADTLNGDPFWATEWVFTPDGDPESQAEFDARGINHVWSPPATYAPECVPGTFNPKFASDIAFVGSYPYPHPEWRYRDHLVEHLIDTYGNRFRRYGGGSLVVRNGLAGPDDRSLNDLYASANVIVGDSLCPGFTKPGYWSDRLPETLGRGGALIWPRIEGVSGQGFTEGEHFLGYDFGDFDGLDAQISRALANPDETRAMAARGQEFVRGHHTYHHRMRALLDTVGLQP